ncbi:hypothetical protein ACROYT_G005684 [Oculina patagonica]
MNELLRRFPSCYADLPVSDLYCGTVMLSDTGQLADGALVTDVDEIMKLRIEKAEELKRKEEEERQKSRKPRRDAGKNDDVNPPEDFRRLRVVPTQEDILSRGRPFLRRNKVDGSYHDAEHYLDVQFRLLREDFVRPLREGIAQLLERIGSPNIGALQDIRVYNNVQFLHPVCTSNGIRHRIRFDNTKLRHVRWENSKRLIYGSLMCLSKDKFDSFVFATVANRELSDITRGILDIQFIHVYDQAGLKEGDVYQMVESTAFFEAYRHVLEGIKETDPAELPFQNYIVNCQKEVEPPAYLKNELQEQVTFDLTPIMKKGSCDTTAARYQSTDTLRKLRLRRSLLGVKDEVRKGANVSLLNLASWPSAEELGLDDSQFKALQMALTKEFAVIQGPPGTGKTYIGLKIANVLLHNKKKWDTDRDENDRALLGGHLRRLSGHRPILVVCYTNHALDQFLEGIHQFHPQGIVRIGGRSQSEIMKACSLSELKHQMHQSKSVPQYIRQAFYEAHVEMDHITEALETATERLKKCHENILHEDELRHRAPSMTAAHYASLKQPFDGKGGHRGSAMLHWLQLYVNLANQASQGETEAELEAEEEKLEEDDNENPDVLYEANVIQDQRILDDDDGKVLGSKSVKKKKKMKVVSPFVLSGEGDDEWQIQKADRLKWKLKRIMTQELSKTDVMQDDKAKMVTNVWNLTLKDRWSLYRRWLMDVRERCRRTISFFQYEFQEGVEQIKKINNALDLEILERADVIGMTTTGAAKYRKLLHKLRPRITIVEEAAEVLESHIVTSLTPGCQHVILIGDHQQLRPNPTVYELAKHYNLDVSLFERMVKNGMPFTRLRLQHRMRPEISKMLEHIYVNPKLENHESVMNFENIKGVVRNVFFVDHEESEDFNEEGMSRSNKHEAKFMAALCRYFILQGYEREQITVLTAYVGQLTQLKKEMPKDVFHGVRVCAVDNFQGEENDIILLSLVRSNEEGKIGFLQIENRVCVALSRAKKGFICIGNISLLETKSPLWSKIINDMRERGNVGKALTLTCQNHPQKVIQASCADDFKKAPDGGCIEPCATWLECGHVCHMMCHPIDPEHKEYECHKPCTKTLCALNHKCPKRCYQDCGPCMEPLEKVLPLCGHLQEVPCYMCEDLSKVKCQTPCSKTWPCGHEHDTKCHVDPLYTLCKVPCGVTLKCGHPCVGNCSGCLRGRVHVPCNESCDRTLFCGHICTKPCAQNCPSCRENCGNYCKHGQCKKKCGKPCDPCEERCIWQCRHYLCTKLCGELCNRPRCNMPCRKQLPCGHPCIGICGEPCPQKCRECHKDEVTVFGTGNRPDARFVQLQDCGHVFEVKVMDQWMDQDAATRDGKQAVVVQLKRCPKCSVPIRNSLRYGNIVKKILADFEQIKEKILLSKGQCDQEAARLKLKVKNIYEFPEDKEALIKSLESKDLTGGLVNMYENQINFLTFLQDLKENIEGDDDDEDDDDYDDDVDDDDDYDEDEDDEKEEAEEKEEEEEEKEQQQQEEEEKEKEGKPKSFDSRFLLQKTKEDLKSKVEQLRDRVMNVRVRFSDQELEELNEEMHRTQLLVDFRMLKTQLDIRGIKLGATDTKKVDYIERALKSEKAIGKDRRDDRYNACIKRIRREQNLQVSYLAVTREGKNLIVKAKGLTQGRWLKCPKGHIYCITKCGGAMEESKCPECGSRIGGHNHQLWAGNRFASEMDGAQYVSRQVLASRSDSTRTAPDIVRCCRWNKQIKIVEAKGAEEEEVEEAAEE